MGRSKHNKSRRQKNKPTLSICPREAEVRKAVNISEYTTEKISWQLSVFDWEGPWGAEAFKPVDFSKFLLQVTQSFETMTWAELPKKQHHSIEVGKLNPCATKRLEEIQQDDLDELFSMRVQGTHRIYGIREGSVMKVLWVDFGHGDNSDCVCRSKKKHT